MTTSPLPLRQKSPVSPFQNRVIVIGGPTACGKSRLGIKIAKQIGGEIVSADSMQVYRGMDIGTAKITEEEKEGIPHHLIDICNLTDSFNVVHFYEAAVSSCEEIIARGGVPIVVGGSGFYLHALIYGPPQGPPASPDLRIQLEEEIQEFGIDPFYEKLQAVDPQYAKTISPRDKHKIIRGLEIITLTGKKVSDFPRIVPSLAPEFDFRCWFIYYPREILYPRIEMRCDEMIAKGFIDEVEQLEKEGLRENLSASQAIGYRQCLDFLDSQQSDENWELFVWEFKKSSRHYAKRQFTWFKKEPLFKWLDIDILGYQRVLELVIQDYESRY
ncbi:MAG: tRNA (adenosine(37)-N6)-dimethylallyltransferase MiaA [Simkania negevensis]|nr:tRNA (adenosine(37)-N6)-dimethylallyltransferase MiaA [Simkania negevensis]